VGVDDRTVVDGVSPIPSADAGELVDTVLDGKYRITRRIGSGSMGDVYEGRQEGTGRRVAIKVLKPERAARDVHRHRFLREARSALMIPHPNVVEVIEVGATERGLLYFSMEYLQGEDLGALLKRRRHLPWSQTKAILVQVAAGLAAAHARGVVHRDVKPSNILLLAGRDPPEVKIVDFGVAKLAAGMVSRVLTSAADVVGTVLYMSPEQAEGEPADERSDIYGLGVMAYETVVGRVPFPGNDIFKVMAAHLRDMPTPPDELVPDLPREASEFIMTCLRKRPADRYPSMDVVLGVLEDRLPVEFDAPGTEVAPTPRADDSGDFEDAPTAYFRAPPRHELPAAPGPKGTTPRVPQSVEARPGQSQRGLTIPMSPPPAGGPDPFSPFASGSMPSMPSIDDLTSGGYMHASVRVPATPSGHTQRVPFIPPDDHEDRSSMPRIVLVALVVLAVGVAIALAAVVT
jgi:serine/threonine protein kinase